MGCESVQVGIVPGYILNAVHAKHFEVCAEVRGACDAMKAML